MRSRAVGSGDERRYSAGMAARLTADPTKAAARSRGRRQPSNASRASLKIALTPEALIALISWAV